MTRIDAKKIAIAVAFSGALGVTTLGLGAGIANADPVTPKTSPIGWSQDHDDWDWHGHGHGPHGGPWPWRGPGVPGGCVAATDPAGLVQGSLCI